MHPRLYFLLRKTIEADDPASCRCGSRPTDWFMQSAVVCFSIPIQKSSKKKLRCFLLRSMLPET